MRRNAHLLACGVTYDVMASAGPTLSYAAAMSQHNTLIPDTPAKVHDKQGG